MLINLEEQNSKKQLERYVRNSKRITSLTGTLAGLVFLGGTLVAAGVLIYQIDIWRKTGTWESLPVIDVLPRILPRDFFRWLNDESSWLALKKTVAGIAQWPLSLFLWLLSLPGVWILATLAHVERFNMDSSRRRLAKLEEETGVHHTQLERRGNRQGRDERRLATTDRRRSSVDKGDGTPDAGEGENLQEEQA